MSNMPLTDGINALIRYANETTGASDTTLSDAVESLVAGYGGGGGRDDLLNMVVGGNITGDCNFDVTTMVSRPFCYATGTYTLTFPSLTSIVSYAFERTHASKVSMPVITYIPANAFDHAYITTFFGPHAYIAKESFRNCTSMTTLVIGGFVNNTYQQACGCSALKVVDISSSTYKMDNTFQTGCGSLDTLILRDSSVLTLHTATTFDSSCFKSGGTGGTIYVPSDLIGSYQSATNWSTIDGYGTVTWKPIEGSIYETQYADGTPIT